MNGPEDEVLEWGAIVWRTHEDNVRRLRHRIFKASQDQDPKRVRELQKLMLRSWSNTLISVRQVTQRNAGRATAGVDGQVAMTPRARAHLARQVHRSLQPGRVRPVNRVYIRERLTNEMRSLHGANALAVIRRINPILRGWCAYYRTVVAKDVFSTVDDHVWPLTYRWALHTHPNKSKTWVAAGLALLARDRGEVAVAFQLLIYPMVDDRNITPSSQAITSERVEPRSEHCGVACVPRWRDRRRRRSTIRRASRASDLSGLPPAYIAVGELDLFLEEDIDYAQRLLQAGVSTELHVYPGAFHGSDMFVADSELSQRWVADRNDALKRALHR